MIFLWYFFRKRRTNILFCKKHIRVSKGKVVSVEIDGIFSVKSDHADGIKTTRHKLVDYSRERLLGQHVPYAIEAWPEAGQSHLSAESGLYCRIFTEGLFGMTPDGFRSFSLLPRLPKEWKTASLKNIKAFGSTFDISLNRVKSGVEAKVTDSSGKVLYMETKKDGEAHNISLSR